MIEERISKKINKDMLKMQAILKLASSDDSALLAFMGDPVGTFKRAGTNFFDYKIDQELANKITKEASNLVFSMARKDFTIQAGGKSMDESVSKSSSSSTSTNFDNSASSTIHFDPMTYTTEGTVSETSEGSLTGTTTSFDSPSQIKIIIAQDGPLISEANVKILTEHIANSIRYAAENAANEIGAQRTKV
jgi:hypothetical protein